MEVCLDKETARELWDRAMLRFGVNLWRVSKMTVDSSRCAPMSKMCDRFCQSRGQ